MHPEGNAGRRKAGTVLVLWTFWPWCFRKGRLGPFSSSASPDKFWGASPGFQVSQLLGDDPTFYLAGYEQLKDTGGPWLRVTGICSVESHSLPLPWWSSDKESTCQCMGHRFDPWSGRIPRALEQLSPSNTSTEPVLQSVCSATRGATAVRSQHSN